MQATYDAAAAREGCRAVRPQARPTGQGDRRRCHALGAAHHRHARAPQRRGGAGRSVRARRPAGGHRAPAAWCRRRSIGASAWRRCPSGCSSPLVGLGASAPAYYPMVAALLGAESRIPAHADVANAVGAVVGPSAAVARVRGHRAAAGAVPGARRGRDAGDVHRPRRCARAFARRAPARRAVPPTWWPPVRPCSRPREQWREQTVDLGGIGPVRRRRADAHAPAAALQLGAVVDGLRAAARRQAQSV